MNIPEDWKEIIIGLAFDKGIRGIVHQLEEWFRENGWKPKGE